MKSFKLYNSENTNEWTWVIDDNEFIYLLVEIFGFMKMKYNGDGDKTLDTSYSWVDDPNEEEYPEIYQELLNLWKNEHPPEKENSMLEMLNERCNDDSPGIPVLGDTLEQIKECMSAMMDSRYGDNGYPQTWQEFEDWKIKNNWKFEKIVDK